MLASITGRDARAPAVVVRGRSTRRSRPREPIRAAPTSRPSTGSTIASRGVPPRRLPCERSMRPGHRAPGAG